ncbi:endonuclease/exonuclease/phosphatase family protein [Mesorhizobium marinum]|uniref:endonuclease/exonuclease/phosphatase family protein n=1 Tax=Mesorhizobium marinum TaxID=3228790 RepID=UPI00346649E4
MYRPVALIAFAASTVLALALVGGFFGQVHPALDSLAHFRIHLAAALIVTAVPLVAARGFRWNGVLAAALGAWAIVNVTGLPFSVQASHGPKDETSPVYRLMHLNLRYDNPEPGEVLSLIGRTRLDVLTLNEVSPMWAEKLDLLAGSYPYRVICRIDNHAGGVAILSLRPFADGVEGTCLEGGTFATATIDLGGRFVEIAALHLHWPWPSDQADQIGDLTPLLGRLADTSILAGDLNATPWSAASARVAAAAAMVPVGPDGPTWLYRKLPAFLRFAGLPIDRIFAKGDVIVHSVETRDAVGSDHLPVLVEFSLKPAEPEDDDAPRTATASLAQAPLY